MKSMKWKKSLLIMLSTVMAFGYTVPFQPLLAKEDSEEDLPFEPVCLKPDLVSPDLQAQAASLEMEEEAQNQEERVRVSVVLEDAPVLEREFSDEPAVASVQSRIVENSLKRKQNALISRIESTVEAGEQVEVVWKMTLAANAVSMYLPRKDIEAVKKLPGVRQVVMERRYDPQKEQDADVRMKQSLEMTKTIEIHRAGIMGDGQRIALIDTGTDTDHQSFNEKAFDYALSLQAEKKGMNLEEYKKSIRLLDAREIALHLNDLNLHEKSPDLSAEQLWLTDKLPFGYNYVDASLVIDHDHDSQGAHGSHVAGIAAANAYLPAENGSFKDALESVQVAGQAPNAQILTMKVFGKNGGAYDSDYMAAIEDAIVLGCDSINLSLGTTNAGNSQDDQYYQAILDRLNQTNAAVVISAGNSGSWADYTKPDRLLRTEDVSLDTVGAPGSYTNAWTVAAAARAAAQNTISLGESKIFCTSARYASSIASLAQGEYEYVWMDGAGTQAQFEQIADLVKGHIVICQRGETTFAQKAAAAASHGAAGLLVANNEDGSFRMSLDGYTGTMPVSGISQEDGALFEKNGQQGVSGGLAWTLGSLIIHHQNQASADLYGSIAGFSSWGAPGSLELKPEIAAPGEAVLSVDGMEANGSSYLYMSGTSMAAPQVSGISALIGQMLKDPDSRFSDTESTRFLEQSLLMSTALPMRDLDTGTMIPVLQQGAGLISPVDAVSARSYLKMHENASGSWADGKIKAELGDDPQKNGVYQFGFDLVNVDAKAASWTLKTEIMSQTVLEKNGRFLVSEKTQVLPAKVTYRVNGKALAELSGFEADVNRDGKTDEKDAQAILDFVTGNLQEKDLDLQAADVDKNDAVEAYDAHLLLENIQSSDFTVESGEKASVEVTITLSEQAREQLSAQFENGTWMEGYTTVSPVADEEGIVDVTHSIPILGFFGDFSDASMVDHTQAWKTIYGLEQQPYLADQAVNGLQVLRQTSQGLADEWVIANPYEKEEPYPEEKTAMRSDELLAAYNFTPIRNAAAGAVVLADESGKGIRVAQLSQEAFYAAWYDEENQLWRDDVQTIPIQKTLEDLGLTENETVRVYLALVPEYLMDSSTAVSEKSILELFNSGRLSKKNMPFTTLTVDDTAPQLLRAAKGRNGNQLTITAEDNQNIALVSVLSPSGVREYARGIPQKQDNGDFTIRFALDDSKIGQDVLIVLADYAGNETSYFVTYNGGLQPSEGGLNGFMASGIEGEDNAWISIDPAQLAVNTADRSLSGIERQDLSLSPVLGADYSDGYVLSIDDSMHLQSAAAADPGVVQTIAGLQESGISKVLDVTFDPARGLLWVLDQENTLWSVSPLTGRTRRVFSVGIERQDGALCAVSTNADGQFFGVTAGTSSTARLYTWSYDPDEHEEGVIPDLKAERASVTLGTNALQNGGLEWDESQKKLYFASMSGTAGFDLAHRLMVIDPQTGEASAANPGSQPGASSFGFPLQALYSVQSDGSVDYMPTDTVDSVSLDCTRKELYPGGSFALQGYVLPWTAENRELSWSSSDESIAVVKEGVVSALKPGSAEIIAASKADPAKTARCMVSVREFPDMNLQALMQIEGRTRSVVLNVSNPSEIEENGSLGTPVYGAVYLNGCWMGQQDGLLRSWDAGTLEPAGSDLQLTSSLRAGAAVPAWNCVLWNQFGSEDFLLYDAQSHQFEKIAVNNPDHRIMAAFAYRETIEKDGQETACFYAVSGDGRLYNMELDRNQKHLTIGKGMETGMDLSMSNAQSQYGVSLLYDAEQKLLFMAAVSSQNSGWYLFDLENNASVSKIASLSEPVFGMINPDAKEAMESAEEGTLPEASQGSLQSIRGLAQNEEKPEESGVQIDESQKQVTLSFRAENSVSAHVQIDYDENLRFVSASAPGLVSMRAQKGRTDLAYASREAIVSGILSVTLAYDRADPDGHIGSYTFRVLEENQPGHPLPEEQNGSIDLEVARETVYRVYNPNAGDHHFTADIEERDHLVSVGWRDEGRAWISPVSSSRPVYRMYNPNAGDHHYTMDAEERDHLISVGWNYEGIGWYSDPKQHAPVYRAYNPNAKKAGSHHYTLSQSEIQTLVKAGWRAEGIGWYSLEEVDMDR